MATMPAGYDAWKTRSPDDERRDRCGDWSEDEEPGCEHPYWSTRYAFLTGKATCRQCSEKMPWCKPLPFVDRLSEGWGDLSFWVRWTALPEIKRPWHAVRKWWRGDRKAPWKVDSHIPF